MCVHDIYTRTLRGSNEASVDFASWCTRCTVCEEARDHEGSEEVHFDWGETGKTTDFMERRGDESTVENKKYYLSSSIFIPDDHSAADVVQPQYC